MALRQARILSSETDNTIQQEQNTNINIKVQQPRVEKQGEGVTYAHGSVRDPCFTSGVNPQNSGYIPTVSTPFYPDVSQNIQNPQSGLEFTHNPNFRLQPPTEASQSQSVAQTSNVNNTINDNEVDELSKRNKFLEMMLSMYENNPLKINSVIIANYHILMDMIKLLCDCDKVDFVLNDDVSCDCSKCGCCGTDYDELIYVSKILVSKNGRTEELKYGFNDVYSQFIKYGISLKIVTK